MLFHMKHELVSNILLMIVGHDLILFFLLSNDYFGKNVGCSTMEILVSRIKSSVGIRKEFNIIRENKQ